MTGGVDALEVHWAARTASNKVAGLGMSDPEPGAVAIIMTDK